MKVATLNVTGKDQPGIIAQTTTALFTNKANILSLDEKVTNGVFSMTLNADVTQTNLTDLKKSLESIKQKLALEIHLNCHDIKRQKNLAILVTKEACCLQELIAKCHTKKIRAQPVVIISNRTDLAGVAKKFKIPFELVDSKQKAQNEKKIVHILKNFNIDFLALARYMQILSPEFVARYEGRVINIHPSLLPAFPGARPYEQAVTAGVTVVGATAHFVTTDLDRGPVICQEAFKIRKADSVTQVQAKGQKIEAQVLARACELFAQDKLALHWGKVYVEN